MIEIKKEELLKNTIDYEDYDDNYYGKYEFDCEELIGDVEDLYKYAKDHNIIPRWFLSTAECYPKP